MLFATLLLHAESMRVFPFPWPLLQVFFTGGKSFLFNFKQRQENARVLSHIFALCSSASPSARMWPAGVFPGAGPSLCDNHEALVSAAASKGTFKPRVPPRRFLSPAQLVEKMEWTKAWARRDISNFDYLMLLNSASGRTVNDLSQYPVFPWVLADYTSATIDVDTPRPGMFRDLSKPMGALNPERLRRFQERRDAFEDPSGLTPPFLYGSHYSNCGTVLYYLLRMEPYTSYALALQSGKFDHADRLFHSVGECWRNCLTNPSDLKELLPEFFYLPEFLRNARNLKLGTRQNGEKLDNVELPPWAHGSPEEFVRINRAALESEYVSAHLQEWIDLIWGFQQQGPASVAANNVFYHLTYESAVAKLHLADDMERRAVEVQIASFGQTPCQLFTIPHPRRMSFDDALREKWVAAMASSLFAVRSAGQRRRLVSTAHAVPVVGIAFLPGRGGAVTLDSAGYVSTHKYTHSLSFCSAHSCCGKFAP